MISQENGIKKVQEELLQPDKMCGSFFNFLHFYYVSPVTKHAGQIKSKWSDDEGKYGKNRQSREHRVIITQ